MNQYQLIALLSITCLTSGQAAFADDKGQELCKATAIEAVQALNPLSANFKFIPNAKPEVNLTESLTNVGRFTWEIEYTGSRNSEFGVRSVETRYTVSDVTMGDHCALLSIEISATN
jgi:hypothetical protein